MDRKLSCGKQNNLKHGHFGTIAAFWHCAPLTISYQLYLLCISKVSKFQSFKVIPQVNEASSQ